MPDVKGIKLVMGIAKSKVLNKIINLFENDPLVTDVHLVSRPHMRLYKLEDAYKIINEIGCSKLREPIIENMDAESEQPDTSTSEKSDKGKDQGSNISQTLDRILKDAKDNSAKMDND